MAKMKILFVFSGGTIGSTKCGNIIVTDSEKPYTLIEKYAEKYQIDFSYDTVEPFAELSENFSGLHISSLLKTISKHLNGAYDGIIVTHGTDTLAYTAAAVGYEFGNKTVPICLVSSNYPIEDERQNGIENLRAAVNTIRSCKVRGTVVLYKNSSDIRVACHRGTRISNSVSLTDDIFSVFNTPLGYVDLNGNFICNTNYTEKCDEIPAPKKLELPERCNEILRVFPYPGMIYPKVEANVSSILLDTYHSGTVDGKSEAVKSFLENAQQRGIKVFVTGNAKYESADVYGKYNVIRLFMSPVAAYVKLWLYGNGKNVKLSRGGDLFE